jgi:hypothetical protein
MHQFEMEKEIARAIRNGETVNITPSGEPVSPTDPKARQGTTLIAPEGKLATGFYWYEKNPELLKSEEKAMKIFFPQFKLGKLDDDRLYWVGTLKPRGKGGIEWTLQVVYANNHPYNTTYGGSIRVYSIKPDLNELNEALGGIPHLLRDENDYFYMCSKRPEDLDNGVSEISSATKSLGWASKWIWVIEAWMNGELSDDDVRGHKY